MTQAALNISRQSYTVALELVCDKFSRLKSFAPTKEVVILGIILFILQISDGVLTAIGIEMFGIAAEGNGFLRCLMEYFGPITALAIAKSFAIIVVLALCRLSAQVKWLPTAMKVVIGVYLIAAIIPWAYILINSRHLIV